MRRLVTTATGTIGRPDSCASVTMPGPQTRDIFGMSAVITTISPSASARSMPRMAATPPRGVLARSGARARPSRGSRGRRDGAARSR